MDCVHCNTCFLLPSSKVQFNLTSCGHIFCDTCLQKNTRKLCKTCGQTYTGIIPLSKKMQPEVQIYFMDIKDLHKNILKQIQQVQLVAEFQKGHLQRLITYQEQRLGKFSEMMCKAKELERKHREVLHENEKLKQFVVSKGFLLADIVGKRSMPSPFPKTPSTPCTSGSSLKNFTSLASIPNVHGNRNALTTPTLHRNLNRSISPMQQSPLNNRNVRSHNASPSGSSGPRAMQRSLQGSSPYQSSGMVASGRITMRTPPVNGKIGPIASSPSLRNQGSSNSLSIPRINMSAQRPGQLYYKGMSSKIGQNLGAGGIGVSPNTTPRLDDKRPIQLNPSRSISSPNPINVGQP